MIHASRGLRRRRGTYLGLCIILLPMAVALFLVVHARLDLALRETQRHQWRVQARLLAESALARQQAAPTAEAAGALEGVGSYRMENAAREGAPPQAVGQVESHNHRVSATIATRPRPGAGAASAPQPIGVTYSVDQIEPWKYK